MKSVMYSALAAAGMMAAGGCSRNVPYTPGVDPLSQTNYPKITTTGDLENWIVAGHPNVAKEGVLKVSVPVRLNDRAHRGGSNVQYRFIFLDDAGNPVRAQPDWMPVRLEPQQQVFMTGNSLDSNASDWRLEIRPQR